MSYIKQFSYLLFVLLAIWVMIQKSVSEKYIPETYSAYNNFEKTILTYNIQKFPWFMKRFSKGDINQLIKKHSIILLQECFDETFESLETCFPQYYICRGNLKGLNAMNSGLAILSKFPIIDVKFYQYKNYNPFSFELFSEKGFLSCLLNINNENIRVINTHLQSSDFKRYDKNAILQLKELMEYLSFLDQNNIKYIVGGDFNIDIKDIKQNNDIKEINENIYYPKDPTIYINFMTSHARSDFKKGYEPLCFDYFLSKNIKMDLPTVIDSLYSDHKPVRTRFY
jgi:endonuclease/exonuclease/phosphatase family metal-dependent hydrolase